MADELKGLKIAILVEEGFEQVGKVRAWKFTNWGEELPVDVKLDQARPQDFDALLLPGGVMNPDYLRTEPQAVAFAKAFFDAGKPVASICHGPWTSSKPEQRAADA